MCRRRATGARSRRALVGRATVGHEIGRVDQLGGQPHVDTRTALGAQRDRLRVGGELHDLHGALGLAPHAPLHIDPQLKGTQTHTGGTRVRMSQLPWL